MDSNTIILISIALFLLLNLFVGFYKGRNVTTIDDYALANRSVGTGVLIITLIATIIGNKYVTGKIIATQERGIIIAITGTIGYVLFSLLLGWYVFPKILRFRGCYTAGDIIGNLYGTKAKLFTGVLSVICFMFVIVSQLMTIGDLDTMLHLPKSSIILGIGLIITFYTWFGGIRAVVATDVVQFAFIIAGFTLIAYKALEKAGDGSIETLFEKVKEKVSGNHKYAKHLSFWDHPEILSRLFIPISYIGLLLSPPIVQRVLMARSRLQVKKTFTGFAIFYPLFYFTIFITGFALMLVHKEEKSIKVSQEFSMLIHYFFNDSTWAKVLFLLIMLAVVMSTADSFLNALAVVIVQDVIKPLTEKSKKTINESQIISYSSLFLGISCTMLALILQKSVSNDIFVFAMIVFGSIAVPFILGCIGLKSNTKAFFLGILGFLVFEGILIYLTYRGNLVWDLKSSAPLRRKIYRVYVTSLVTSSILYPLIVAIVNGGLVFEKIKKPEMKMRNLIAKRENKENFSYLFRHPLLWAQNKMIHYGSQPMTIGLLLSLACFIPIIPSKILGSQYEIAFFILRFIGLLLCGYLMIHTVWMRSYKRYFPLFWWLTLMYNLPFSYTMLWLFDPANTVVVLLLSLSVLVLFLLVDWRAFSVLFSLGTVLAIVVELLVYGTEKFSKISIVNHAFPAILGIVGAVVVGHFVGKRKEKVDAGRIQRTKTWASAFGHDLGNIFWNILLRHPDSSCPLSVCHILENKFKKIEQEGDKGFFIKEDQYKLLSESAQIVKRDLKECMNQMDVFRKLVSKDSISPDLIVNTPISKVLQDSYETIPYVFKEYVKILPQQKDFSIKVHPILMHNVVLNLAKNARYHGGAEEIVLTWDTNKRQLLVKDNGKGIPPHVEPYIFDLYYTTGGQGVGLPFVKMILEQMGASINFTTSEKGTTFFVTFE